MRSFVVPLLVVSMLFLSGCATVFKGGTQEVAVNSNPQGVEILIDGVSYGTTPTSLQLEVDRSYQIVLDDGVNQRTFFLQSQIGALWIVLDVLTGLVPLIVDAATGDWYELQPNQVYVDFGS